MNSRISTNPPTSDLSSRHYDVFDATLRPYELDIKYKYKCTRDRGKIDIPCHRLSKTAESFKINCIHFFNKLSLTAAVVHLNKFKFTLNNWLPNNPFYSVPRVSC